MNFFFVIIFIIFVVLPWFNKSKGKPKKKGPQTRKPVQSNWGMSHDEIKNKYGHSDKKNTTHKRLHQGDTNTAFPQEHQERVRQRDLRDTAANRKMEKNIHNAKNVGIIKAGNKSRDDWGVKGDKTSFTGLFMLIIFSGVALYIWGIVA